MKPGRGKQREGDAIEVDGAAERGADVGGDAALEAADVEQGRDEDEEEKEEVEGEEDEDAAAAVAGCAGLLGLVAGVGRGHRVRRSLRTD